MTTVLRDSRDSITLLQHGHDAMERRAKKEKRTVTAITNPRQNEKYDPDLHKNGRYK
jgi:hypothetical protein